MIKGALISVSPLNPVPNLIRFQYNPTELTRNVKPSFYSGSSSSGGRQEPARFSGAPTETITLNVQLEASYGMAAGSPLASTMGVQPQIATLELLAYPSLITLAQNTTLLASGTIEAVPVVAPRTLLVFGLSRIVPVRVTSIDVTEELFNSNLFPIRAKVKLAMDVVTYSQVYPSEPLFVAHAAYQAGLEVQAALLQAMGAAETT